MTLTLLSGHLSFGAQEVEPPYTPVVISSIVATVLSQSSVRITWNVAPGAQGQVLYDDDQVGDYAFSTTLETGYLTSHSQTITGLTAGTQYWFKVRTVSVDSIELLSNEGSFTTDEALPAPGGGSYPVPTTLVYAAPTDKSLPPLGVWVTDTTTPGGHTQYMRVSPVAVRKQYSTHRCTNMDETRIRLEGGRIVSTANYALLGTVNEPGMPVWSYVHPDRIYGVSSNRLEYVNTTTNSRVTVRSFTGYSLIYSGFGDGNPSRKGAAADRYWALYGVTTGGQPRLISYDAVADTIRGTRDVTGPPNALGMDVTGTRVIANWAGTGRGSTPNCVDIYDAASSSLTFVRRLAPVGDHGDAGEDINGNTIGPANVWSFRVDQSTSSLDVGRLLPHTLSGKGTGAYFQQGHVSMQAEDRPGYAYVSAFGGYTLMSAYGGPLIPGRQQIIAVKTDGSSFAAGAGIEVYGFNRSDWACDGCGGDPRYDREPQAVPNRDGSEVYVNSRWLAAPSTDFSQPVNVYKFRAVPA
jgi:hypothetical protein